MDTRVRRKIRKLVCEEMLFIFTKKIVCHVYEHLHVHEMFYTQLTSLVFFEYLFLLNVCEKRFMHMNPNYAVERIEFYSNLNNTATSLY